MRVLIVGGGVAGPATALALQQVGIDTVVLERRPAGDQSGSWMTVSPNGLDALDLLGALPLAKSIGVPTRENQMFGATGRLLGSLPLGSPLSDGTPALSMRRTALGEGLTAEAVARGIEVRHDSTVTHVGPGAVDLLDGTRITGDLVVGADGVHSVVRRAIDPAAPSPRYVGLTNFGGITRATPVVADLAPEAWHFVFGRRAFFGALPTPDGDVVWFVNAPRPEITREERAGTAAEQWQQVLYDLMVDDAGPAAVLIRDGRLDLMADNTYDLPHVPHWFGERMVVVGDAAHAPSPSSGQGASLALEDSVVLARALRDAGTDVSAALTAYEQARRDRVERIVAAGARSSSAKIPGPIGRRVQDLVLPLVFRWVVTPKRSAWITDHRLAREPYQPAVEP